MRADLAEFLATGSIDGARRLTAATGQHFNADRLPQFFTGDLDAPVVLMHLNPKQANGPIPIPMQSSEWQTTARSLAGYFDACRYFGARMYGPSSRRTHRSPFDHKQLRFLRPLGVIDFVQERCRTDRFVNLERAVDDKLQLELVPYGSASFAARGFTPAVLAPHLSRVLSTIAPVPRRYVLFCGPHTRCSRRCCASTPPAGTSSICASTTAPSRDSAPASPTCCCRTRAASCGPGWRSRGRGRACPRLPTPRRSDRATRRTQLNDPPRAALPDVRRHRAVLLLRWRGEVWSCASQAGVGIAGHRLHNRREVVIICHLRPVNWCCMGKLTAFAHVANIARLWRP